MINTRQYKFTIINTDTSEEKVLAISPGGWETVQERIYRHEDYHGILFEDETSLKYPKIANDGGGYQFILDAYEAKGVKANLYLKREHLNPYTNGYELDAYRKFDFDVDTGWHRFDEFVEIKTVESSYVNKLLVRDEIEYDLFSLKSSDNVTVKAFNNAYKEALYKKIDIYLDGNSYGYFNGQFEQLTVTYNTGDRKDNKTLKYIGTVDESDIDDRFIVTDTDETAYWYENTTTETRYLTNVFINFDIKSYVLIMSESENYAFWLSLIYEKYDENNELQSTNSFPVTKNGDGANILFLYRGGKSPIGSEKTFWVDKNCELRITSATGIEVPAGWRVDFRFSAYLENYSNGLVIAVVNAFTNANHIKEFSFSERTPGRPDNSIKGLMSHEVMTRQLQLMTSDTAENIMYSPILGKPDSEFQTYTSAGFLAYEHFTNGYLLRQFNDKALNISFKDTFKSLDSEYPIGLWFDTNFNNFYLDKIEQFYKTEMFTFVLEEIKDLDVYPAKYFYYNEIDSGYPKIDHEDFQGVKEVNTETAHQISIETSSKLDARSVYNTGSIGIELARRKNRDTAASEDTKYDSEIFFTKLNSDYETIQGELEDLEGFSGISEYYNLTKTPRQNLQRQMKLFQAALFKDQTEIVQFTSSEKDNNISYKDPQTGAIVKEFDDISQTGESMTKPEFYEFQSLYSYAIRQEIKKDPHRVLPFIDKYGVKKYGYLWEITASPYTRLGTYKLIRANENRLNL